MKITTTQLNPKTADVEHNLNQMIDMIIDASLADSQLIVFPELALSGLKCEYDFHKVAITTDSHVIKNLASLAALYNIVIVFGAVEEKNNILYNSAFIIDTDKSVQVVRKTKLFRTEEQYLESRYFEPGRDIAPIQTSLGKMGLLICYDIFSPDFSSELASKGADFFVVISGIPKLEWKILESILYVRSLENAKPLIYSNLVGVEGDNLYCGGSCIIQQETPDILPSKIFTDLDDFEPKILTANFKLY